MPISEIAELKLSSEASAAMAAKLTAKPLPVWEISEWLQVNDLLYDTVEGSKGKLVTVDAAPVEPLVNALLSHLRRPGVRTIGLNEIAWAEAADQLFGLCLANQWITQIGVDDVYAMAGGRPYKEWTATTWDDWTRATKLDETYSSVIKAFSLLTDEISTHKAGSDATPTTILELAKASFSTRMDILLSEVVS